MSLVRESGRESSWRQQEVLQIQNQLERTMLTQIVFIVTRAFVSRRAALHRLMWLHAEYSKLEHGIH